MPQRVLSTDPNAGEPIQSAPSPRVLSTDPNAGESVEVKTRARTWADRMGLNEPTDSMGLGFLRGAGGAAVDMAQGAASEIVGSMQGKLAADQAAAERVRPGSRVGKQLPESVMTEAPPTTAGTIGTYLPAAASLASPGGAAVKAGVNALPSAARAGEKFQAVMGAAKDVPVNVEPLGKAALRIMDLAERGGSMPKAVRDILKRVTDPAKTPMTYKEARDFASNIGRLSVDEMNRLTPVVKRQVAELAAELNKANAEAARIAGKGAEYKAAMREYARAMRMRDALDTVIKKAKKLALPAAAGGGAAYWLGRD